MNKGGISVVVASVLVILISIASISIVWLGIVPMISDLNIDMDADLELVSTEGYTLWDPESRLATIQIEGKGDASDIVGIDIVFSLEGNTVTHFVEEVPGMNSKKVYYVNLSEYSGELDFIQIVPIFKGGVAGNVASKLDVSRIPEANLVELIEEDSAVDAGNFEQPSGSGSSGGGGSSEESPCTPKSSCEAGECGSLSDGCGGLIDCGECGATVARSFSDNFDDSSGIAQSSGIVVNGDVRLNLGNGDYSDDLNLVSIYLFEDSNLGLDSKGPNNMNTVVGDPTSSMETPSGFSGNSIDLDGDDSVCIGSGFTFDSADDHTLCFWVRPGSTETHNIFAQACGYDTWTADNGATYRWHVNNCNGGVTDSFNVANAFQVGTWTHICQQYDVSASTRVVIVNGTSTYNHNSEAIVMSGSADWCIGSYGGGGFWNGEIYSPMWFDRLLTTTEMQNVYQGTYFGSSEFGSGSFVSEPITAQNLISRINSVNWNEVGTDASNTITVELSFDSGNTWNEVANGLGLEIFTACNSFIYRVSFDSVDSVISFDDISIAFEEEAVATCGNDVIEQGEVCDSSASFLETCQSLGFESGSLSCLGDCSGYDTSPCVSCADTCSSLGLCGIQNICGESVDCGSCACAPVADPCGLAVCGNVLNGTCGTISCGSCSGGDICSAGACVAAPAQETIVANHNAVQDFDLIPQCWIEEAKQTLDIGYGHTSHGSQITSGLYGFNYFMNGLGETPTDLYDWNRGGTGGALNIDEGDGYGDGWLDHDAGYTGWDDETRYYLDGTDPGAGSADHSNMNTIMWSWCGQASYIAMQSHYIDNMVALQSEYPGRRFIHMTGHLDGTGLSGGLHLNNDIIRNHVTTSGGILFDFEDIESYGPDGVYYGDRLVNDNCDYDSTGDGTRDSNWATDWQDSHTQDVDWYAISCAHSQSLNCNQKAKAAWWMFARMAGWDGTAGDVCP